MRRKKKVTLNKWYKAVKEDLQAHSIKLSKPTIVKFTREWLNAHIPFADLPEGIGPYCITTRKDFEGVKWILVWSALIRQFSEVGQWLKNAESPSGAFPGELPHEILPRALQDTLNRRLDFPLGPRCYDSLIRETLRHPQIRMEYGHRYPIVLRAIYPR